LSYAQIVAGGLPRGHTGEQGGWEDIYKERPSDTREVEFRNFTPSQSDVQNLIAAIAKIEKKERTYVTSDRRTEKDEANPPAFSPTRKHWRLSKVLDSIANLCVSETKHEVIATALRVHNKAELIELIIASNDNVKSSTVEHLRKMWTALKEISTICHNSRELSSQDDMPPRLVDDAHDLSTKFRILCLKFSFDKLQKRVNEKFSRFSEIDIRGMDESHDFRKVRKYVNLIEHHFTRENKPVVGKPGDDKSWKRLWACLMSAAQAINKFLDAGGFHGGEKKRFGTFLQYDLYLRKIESFANDIQVLLHAANSPQCKHLFTFEFEINALPVLVSKAVNVPQTSEEWELVLEEALLFRNAIEGKTHGNYVINVKRVNEDTAYMAEDAISRDLVVHCEVKILTHIFKTEAENPGIPKAYTYIGVSKLSCRSCQAFFEAFNDTHATRFVVKGSHSKSYWPWQFPELSFANMDAVVYFTYQSIAKRWANSYNGYIVKEEPHQPDSEAQSSASRFDDVGEIAEADVMEY